MSIVLITGAKSRHRGQRRPSKSAQRGMGVILTYKSDAQAALAVVRTIESAGGYII